MWTRKSLHDLAAAKLKDIQLIVVANREPYIHRRVENHIECVFPASGMATALDPVMQACGGIWIGHGSGDADRQTVDDRDKVRVPPDDPKYTLRRLWLSKSEEQGYYYGVSNSALWPLCHITFTRPTFNSEDWATYRAVNQKFADAVLAEAGDKPTFVFIQDFHFALLPRMLKQANPNLIVAQFWHIPWPNRETFRAFPWKDELLDGMLGNDLLGFHLRYHCQNFLDTVDRAVEARVDHERAEITRFGKPTLVRPFPISIDFTHHSAQAASSKVDSIMDAWRIRLQLQDEVLGVGIDRLDYTKGIPERFKAVDRFLDLHPEFRKRLVFVQIAVPSRSHIPHYQQLDEEVDKLAEQINWKWSEGAWQPIVLLKQHFGQPELMALHRLANFCLVTSLHDGLNLVAKEFVASRIDEDGVLILSQFTGAARELADALQVNPFAVDEIVGAMQKAIEMPEPERRKRMNRMRETVEQNNVYRWAGKMLSALLKFDFPE
jgi:alpha,alpha-trehalose-phosphate synthase [UDP-forming]